MGINKVEFAGEVLIDLTNDTTTAETTLAGYTGHGADGEPFVGTMATGANIFSGADVPSNDMGSDGDYYILQEKSIEDKNTLLLLHGDSLIDNSIYNVPITNSGATVSTEQSKFGESSLYFNGSSGLLFSAKVCDFGTGDFTFDWWEFATSTNAGARFCTQFGVAYTGMSVGNAGKTININENYNNPGWDLINGEQALTITQNVWVHYAFMRNGANIYLYRNGIKTYEKNIGNVVLIINPDINSAIGENPSGDASFIGYIDEFRISDIARWTENFTPPAEPYNTNTLQAGEIYYKTNGVWLKVLSGINDNELAKKQNKVTYGTNDLTAGSSALATGEIYFVYE